MSQPEVSVLLATLNGEEFIEEFLESLVNQVGVEINLYISDDGSTDQTLDIIKTYKDRFKFLELIEGPKSGPSHNFFHLLEKANGKIFAFADQDDIWFPKKLERAIRRFKKINSPCLYTSSVMDFDGTKISRSPYGLPISIMRNNSQGCTMVFNLELRKLMLGLDRDKIVMHDWCALLMAQIHGQILFDDEPTIYYRLHQKNFVGHQSTPKRMLKYLQSLVFSQSKNLVMKQALEIMKTHGQPNQSVELREWCRSVNGPFISRLEYLFKHKKVFLRSIWSVACALQILMGKFRL
jgi:glycosyltransferase involved in cell wall biosynthesis